MLEFVVVAEAAADVRHACALADRVFAEEGPDWMRDQELHWLRSWTGVEPNTPYSTWRDIRQLSRQFPELSFLRRYITPGQKREHLPDYAPARKAILLSALLRKNSLPNAVLLVRDLDHQPERLEGMSAARDDEQAKHDTLVVVLATPKPKREAWTLNGFIASGKSEETTLAAICEEINFHPCEEADRLRYSSQTSLAERDPKKILERLTENNGEREARCWNETPLPTLRERGAKTLLTDYLDEVKDKLLPLFNQ